MPTPQTSPRTPAAPTGGAERRAAERYPSNLETSCRPLSASRGEFWAGQVKDVSTGGIGLIMGRRFERGTLLVIDLDSAEGDSRTLLARVVHATAQPERKWLMGCAFIRELGVEELAACGAQRVRPRQPDSRAWVRFPCDLPSVCYTDAPDASEALPATVVNISAGGVALLLSRPIDKGTLLHIELPDPEGTGMSRGTRRFLVRVVQGQAQGDDWLLGCEFAEKLDDPLADSPS